MLSFKAGRCTRRGETNWVDPAATKGVISLESSPEDGLLHFLWKNRDSGSTDNDLIIFPSEASFSKVTQAADGRVYVLKFTSSNQRHFYWLQDEDTSRDEQRVNHVNGLLEDPTFVPVDNVAPQSAPEPSAAVQPTSGVGHPPTEDELRQLREIIQNASSSVAEDSALALSDVLTPQTLEPLFARPDLLHSIFPNLPADLPAERNPEALRQVVQSSAFRTSLRGLDQALSTGLLGGLVTSLGLPEEAGMGVGPFLRAISEQARNLESGQEGTEDADQMDTD